MYKFVYMCIGKRGGESAKEAFTCIEPLFLYTSTYVTSLPVIIYRTIHISIIYIYIYSYIYKVIVIRKNNYISYISIKYK